MLGKIKAKMRKKRMGEGHVLGGPSTSQASAAPSRQDVPQRRAPESALSRDEREKRAALAESRLAKKGGIRKNMSAQKQAKKQEHYRAYAQLDALDKKSNKTASSRVVVNGSVTTKSAAAASTSTSTSTPSHKYSCRICPAGHDSLQHAQEHQQTHVLAPPPGDGTPSPAMGVMDNIVVRQGDENNQGADLLDLSVLDETPLQTALRTLSGHPDAQATKTLLGKMARKILDNPDEPKFRTCKLTNKTIKKRIVDVPGALDSLLASGFERVLSDDAATIGEEVIKFGEQQDLALLRILELELR